MTRLIVITIICSFATILTAKEYIFSDREAVQHDLKKHLQQLYPSQYPLVKYTYLAQHEQFIGEPVVVVTEPARPITGRAGCQGSMRAGCSGSLMRAGYSGQGYRGLFWRARARQAARLGY